MVKIGAKSRSPLKEHRLLVPLQANVETQRACLRPAHQGRNPVLVLPTAANNGSAALAALSSGK